ncbi:MAG: D-alanine--D-alanine ligase [Kiloniellales bacterium]
MSKTVAVLMGGRSSEREVSFSSGRECAKALREAGYQVREVDVGHEVGALIAALEPKPDVVFNALHGRWGEDGTIQGLLELLDLRYTHSGVMASAVAMDKVMTKHLVAVEGIASPEGEIVARAELLTREVMTRPYVIKPNNEGSSVGVRIVLDGDNSPPITADDWRDCETLLVERYIPGRELTVGVMGERALTVTELAPTQGFYDYAAKYTEGRTKHTVPAPVPGAIFEEAMSAAVAAHRVLGCRGVTRSDFRYDDQGAPPGRLYFLEINTQPGMTPLSLVPEQAKHVGIGFPELCSWMVENAACDY